MEVEPEKLPIFRTISHGFIVRYPEEIVHHRNGLILRRDFRMNGFPRRTDGTIRYDIPDEEYLAWLADYLPENLPPLTTEQEQVRTALADGVDISPIYLGTTAGWLESNGIFRPFHVFPADFAENVDFDAVWVTDGGFSYDYYLEYMDEDMRAINPLLSREEYILEDFGWHLMLQEDRQQFAQYWPDFSPRDGVSIVLKMDSLRNVPPDAGWRVYLGLMLRGERSREERMNMLEKFYLEWQDILSK